MKQRDYTYKDLIRDELFVQWVRDPDAYSDSFWKSFIEQYPEKLTELEKARHFIDSLAFPAPDIQIPDEQAIEEEYKNLIRRSDERWKERKSENSFYQSSFFRYAAVLTVVFMFAFLWQSINKEMANEEETLPEIAMVERSVAKGQRLPLELPDGTKVKLNAESRLIFPAEFSTDKREVILEGEGFFEVTKDIYKPFIVKTKNMTTIVLGTSFNINAYDQKKEAQVAVLSGKVKVTGLKPGQAEHLASSLVLEPSQAVSFSEKDYTFHKEDFNYRKAFSWKDNVLYFENAGFSEVIDKIAHWYGKEFEIRVRLDKVKDFTARYDNQPLDMVLEGLSFAYGVQFKVEGNKVIIYQ